MSNRIAKGRLARLDSIILKWGKHDSFEAGACPMEAVSWLAGEDKYSDCPKCVCPVIAAFVRRWSDRLPTDEDRTRLLLPLLLTFVGTRATAAIERRRGYLATDWSVRVQAPAIVRMAGLEDLAVRLETLPEVTRETSAATRTVLEYVRLAAWSEEQRRWLLWCAAASDADADATATARAAYADAVAASAAIDAADTITAATAGANTAGAVAEVAADAADAVASAVAAAAAIADAAVVDAAADAAYADNIDASKAWRARQEAVYETLRRSFRVRWASVISAQEISAQNLVRRMCELTEEAR
jgi:hypothetical protein